MSPKRGDMGDWKNYRLRHLDRRRGPKPRRKYFVTHGMREKYDNGCRDLFESCDPVKTQAQDIQRTEQAVRPRWEKREGTALERGCSSTLFSCGELGGFLFVLRMFCLCCVCVCFPNYFSFSGDRFSAKLKVTRGDVYQGSSR